MFHEGNLYYIIYNLLYSIFLSDRVVFMKLILILYKINIKKYIYINCGKKAIFEEKLKLTFLKKKKK